MINDPNCEDISAAKFCLGQTDFKSALTILDILVNVTSSANASLARATVRETVNDLEGALSDLHSIEIESDEKSRIEAKILAKMGKYREATSLLQKVPAIKRIGILGRRVDIESIGLKPGLTPDRCLNGWETGCVLSHLMALAEWQTIDKILPFLSEQEARPFVNIYNGMKSRRALFSIESLRESSRVVDGIPGWFSSDEAAYMGNLARGIPANKAIVEIGSYCGRSTASLAFGSSMGFGALVHSVDPHLGLVAVHDKSTLGEFLKNLRDRDLYRYVVMHKGFSTEVARTWRNKNIDILFIDADHGYESVKSDFESWNEHISSGALVIFHDYPQAGPNRLIREILEDRHSYHPIAFFDTLFVFEFEPSREDYDFELRNLFIDYVMLCGRAYANWLESEQRAAANAAIESLTRLSLELECDHLG